MSALKRPEDIDWIRSEIDVDLARKAVEAARRALLSHDREASPRDIVFTLICEAAQTEKAMKALGPRGHVSCVPEVYHSASEIFATEIAMVADRISFEPKIKPSVTADAAGRYMEVTKWLRFVEGRDRAKSKELLWLLAQNAPDSLIAKRTGYQGRTAIRAARYRRLGDIVARLERCEAF